MTRYSQMTRPELQALRTRFIAILAGCVSNRAQVEIYLAGVEAALVAMATAEQATVPSIAEMRSGTRAPRNAADRERLAWSHWS